MKDRTPVIAAISGLIFVVGQILGGFLYPQPPDNGQSPTRWLEWADAHRGALHAGMTIGILTLPMLLVFVAHLADRTRELPLARSLITTSGVALALMALFGALPLAMLSLVDTTSTAPGDLSVVRFIVLLTGVLFAFFNTVAVLFLLTIAAVRHVLGLPNWIAAIAVLAAVLNIVSIFPSVTFSTYHGALWAGIGWAAYLGVVIVVAAMSIQSLLALRSAETTATVSTAAVA